MTTGKKPYPYLLAYIVIGMGFLAEGGRDDIETDPNSTIVMWYEFERDKIPKAGHLAGIWLFLWITAFLHYLDALSIKNSLDRLSVFLDLVASHDSACTIIPVIFSCRPRDPSRLPGMAPITLSVMMMSDPIIQSSGLPDVTRACRGRPGSSLTVSALGRVVEFISIRHSTICGRYGSVLCRMTSASGLCFKGILDKRRTEKGKQRALVGRFGNCDLLLAELWLTRAMMDNWED
jgi:hypothetical protein